MLICRTIFIILLFASQRLYAEALRIGVILPLSGKAASVGVAMKNGMQMAYQTLPEEIKSSLELSFEDDFADSKQTVSIAQKLIGLKQTDLIVTAFSNSGNAVVPITERASMPLISLAYDRGISDNKKYAFTFWVNLENLAQEAVKEGVKRGYKNIAVIASQHEGNIAMKNKFLSANADNFIISYQEEVSLSETDFNSYAQKIKRQPNIDGIVLLMHSAHLGLFIKSIRNYSIELPIFTLGNFEDRNVRVVAGDSLRNAWYSRGKYKNRFLEEYQNLYSKDSTFGAAYGHDLILLLADAAKNKVTKATLPEYLKTASFKGVAFDQVEADGANGYKFPVEVQVVGEDGIH